MAEALDTIRAVGWVVQARIRDVIDTKTATPAWHSWTQWKQLKDAETQAQALLRRSDVIETRVVRVDWTVERIFKKEEGQ